MSIKRIKTLRHKEPKDIFEFNHIASTLNPEKIQQIKDLYFFIIKKHGYIKTVKVNIKK